MTREESRYLSRLIIAALQRKRREWEAANPGKES